MKNIFIYTPDGTGIRNYVYANVFKNRNARFTLLHSFENDVVNHVSSEIDLDGGSIKLPDLNEGIRDKWYRELINLTRLQYNAKLKNNETILSNFNKTPKTFKLKAFYTAIRKAAPFFKKYDQILKLETAYQQAIRQNIFYKKVLDILLNKKPDAIFLTHQRAVEASYVFAAAHDLGIKTVTVIYSWDNLPKARLYLKADKYLVWSEYMKSEMNEYYPEIDQNKVVVTGTPQFSFYADTKKLETRDVFAQEHGLNPNKKWICYSGDDTITSPNDPIYLRHLAETITNSNFNDTHQILLRRCPADNSGRFESIIADFPELIISVDPLWLDASSWTSIFPEKQDVYLLMNTVYHCDAVFNIGSTMAFDFVQYDRPCVYINYDVNPEIDWSVEVIYQFQHFKSMTSQDAVLWLDGKDQIITTLRQIDSGSYNLQATKNWFHKIVKHPVEANDRIYNALIN